MMENDAYLIRIVDESGRNVMGKTNVMILKGQVNKNSNNRNNLADRKKQDILAVLIASLFIGVISGGGLWNAYKITRRIKK